MSDTQQNISVPGQDVYAVIKGVQGELFKHDPDTVIMALLAIIFMIENPDMSPEENVKAVQEASSFIADYIDAMAESRGMDPAKAN